MGELPKYGGSGMVSLLEQLSIVWREEAVRRQWREGLFITYLRKGIEKIQGTTEVFLSIVRFCKVQ